MGGVSDQVRAIVTGDAFTKPLEQVTDDALKDSILAKLTKDVPDAFSKLAKFLDEVYTPFLRTEIACTTGYPDGPEYYQTCLEFHTTTTMTAQEIHDMGLSEVARINSGMLCYRLACPKCMGSEWAGRGCSICILICLYVCGSVGGCPLSPNKR